MAVKFAISELRDRSDKGESLAGVLIQSLKPLDRRDCLRVGQRSGLRSLREILDQRLGVVVGAIVATETVKRLRFPLAVH